jgi:hypothetical protein
VTRALRGIYVSAFSPVSAFRFPRFRFAFQFPLFPRFRFAFKRFFRKFFL